jgi:hypothetical protein
MEFVTTALFNPRTLTWDCTSNCTATSLSTTPPAHRIHLHKADILLAPPFNA